jgi:hypothetical protein
MAQEEHMEEFKPGNQPEVDTEIEIEEQEQEQEADAPEVEIEDDTPEEDRGREPMPKEIVDELEADELDEYSDKVKTRLKQMKKVWHDERREKERVLREQREAVAATQKLLEENRRLKQTLSKGEQDLLETYRKAAEYEQEAAKRAYREAYEAGDTDKVLEAQEMLNSASYKMQQINNYQPTLQQPEQEVESPQQVQQPQLDQKTIAWQERNSWWGSDDEMTASALGLHQKLVRERGPQYAGTDEYWDAIDKTMRRRFPEYFGEALETGTRAAKPAPVVASASRSRSPKKIVLKQSQLAIAKKLGLTPEQYAKELMKVGK